MARRTPQKKPTKQGVIFEKDSPFFVKYRDFALFIGGVAGVVHETVLVDTERPTLLILFAAMMGLPAFLRSDEKKGE